MRLVNTETHRLEEFGPNPPTYAVLSHAWEDGEILYEDIIRQDFLKKGHYKVLGCCELAQSKGYQYIWIDTCCIDKSSSTELSEAINSMFAWYAQAAVCYVYLDIEATAHRLSESELSATRWISRGWTLQELIAPKQVDFYDRHWRFCGDRQTLAWDLHEITAINLSVLEREPGQQYQHRNYSIARRMSWAASRNTKRSEDIAYCLLGIFDVHLPLLYGEGAEKAFRRLQEEIIKHSVDYSILAWTPQVFDSDSARVGAFARSPSDFRLCHRTVTFRRNVETFEVTNKGLRVRLPVVQLHSRTLLVLSNCRQEDDFTGPLGIVISQFTESVYVRRASHPVPVKKSTLAAATMQTVYLSLDTSSVATEQTRIEATTIPFQFQFQFKDLEIGRSLLAPLLLRRPNIGRWDESRAVWRLKASELMFIDTYIVLCGRQRFTRKNRRQSGRPLLKISLKAASPDFSLYPPCAVFQKLPKDGKQRNIFKRAANVRLNDFPCRLQVSLVPGDWSMGEEVHKVVISVQSRDRKLPGSTSFPRLHED